MSFDRSTLEVGIVHLGVGAFHRAHQAVYTDAVLHRFGGNWGICGVSLRSPDVRDALIANDNVYTVAVKSSSGTELSTIRAIQRMLVAPENPAAVISAIADPAVQVVTLTITEKGYCLEPATGELDRSHSDVAHDLAEPHSPRTAAGYLVAGLVERKANARSALTLISCDNLAANGNKLKHAVLQMAESLDPDLAIWIARYCRFPNTMVDRIVPAIQSQDLTEIESRLGHVDPAAVVTEPFSQWVIEQNFAGPVPAWNAVGAEFVDDVTPYEHMKLRMLNASHSVMAYLGSLAGYATVAEVIDDPAFRALVEQLMAHEMAPTLEGLGEFDVAGYQRALIERFSNRNLPHLTRQIAMDGSQKIPQRLLPGIAERLAAGHPPDAALCGLAGWIAYTTGFDGQGNTHTVEDPMSPFFAACFQDSDGNPSRYLDSLLRAEQIFPPTLARSAELRRGLLSWLEAFQRQGVRQTVHGAQWRPTGR